MKLNERALEALSADPSEWCKVSNDIASELIRLAKLGLKYDTVGSTQLNKIAAWRRSHSLLTSHREVITAGLYRIVEHSANEEMQQKADNALTDIAKLEKEKI